MKAYVARLFRSIGSVDGNESLKITCQAGSWGDQTEIALIEVTIKDDQTKLGLFR